MMQPLQAVAENGICSKSYGENRIYRGDCNAALFFPPAIVVASLGAAAMLLDGGQSAVKNVRKVRENRTKQTNTESNLKDVEIEIIETFSFAFCYFTANGKLHFAVCRSRFAVTTILRFSKTSSNQVFLFQDGGRGEVSMYVSMRKNCTG